MQYLWVHTANNVLVGSAVVSKFEVSQVVKFIITGSCYGLCSGWMYVFGGGWGVIIMIAGGGRVRWIHLIIFNAEV